MNRRYIEIVLANTKSYNKKEGISFPGAVLKNSLIPLGLFERYIPETATILDLGCGEGMLSNALARLLPQATVYGVDLDREKIRQATLCRIENAHFTAGDAGQFVFKGADVVIFNDVLHHNSYEDQDVLLSHASSLIKTNGLLILKEVDAVDKVDKKLTTFFDSRLYPNDVLHFRTADEWRILLEAHNFEVLTTEVVKHPWIASRTVFLARKSPTFVYYEEKAPEPSLGSAMGKLRIFLTGASGFIGHHMATHLLQHGLDGQEVDLVLLARSPVRIDPVLRERATIIKGDLVSLKGIRHWKIFDQIDYVFHFAAEVKLYGDPKVLMLSNTEGTRCLLDVFKGRKLKRFVHASTMGAVDRQPGDACVMPMNEESAPNPLTVYGKTKLQAEKLVRDSGLPYAIVRIPWAFGSRMTEDTHVRNLMERVMRGSLATRINFPGKVSLIAVEDLMRAFVLAASHPQALNETFFVGGYLPISLGELFRRMARCMIGKPANLVPIPYPVQLVARMLRRFLPLAVQSLNSNVLCVDYSKIKNLGFKPEKDLDASLTKLSKWVHSQKHPKGKVYVVTGAASGIGLELSKKLIATGKRVLLVDKNEERLAEVANTLEVHHLCLDLSLPDSVNRLLTFIKSEREFYCLVNCAGIGRRDALFDMMPEKIDEQINVNIASLVKLSKGALGVFRARGEGVLVNISSSAALQPLPYFSVYAASKAFVSSFTSSIAYEVAGMGDIRVIDVIPSGTDTGFQVAAGVKKSAEEKLLSPAYVADRIATLIEKKAPSGTYYVGNRARMMSYLARVLPRNLNTKIWGRLVTKMR